LARALGLAGLVPAIMATAAEADGGLPQPTSVAEVVIVGTTPLPGSGVDLDKVPAHVQTLGGEDLDPDNHVESIAGAAARRMGSVNLNEELGNRYQPDFVYRGFEASPISGIAEGLAVYQNGTRINEAFGDNVNWDLVPQFAVERLTVQSNNPVFGLNALGGAVTLEMKNAFNSPGGDVEISHGNFNNTTGYAAYGLRDGNFGAYAAIGGVHDSGFRFLSPTYLRQGYGDFGYEDGRTSLHAGVTGANNYIGALGPTPVEMLAADPRAIFTSPQAMHNQMQLLQLTGSRQATDTLALAADGHYRHFEQHIADGNTTDVTPCTNNGSFFCLEGNALYPADALYDNTGNQVPTGVLATGATPGQLDFIDTNTNTAGAAFQATLTAPFAGRENHLVLGGSIDHSITHYAAHGELGAVLPNLAVVSAGLTIDQGASPSASAPIQAPVSVRSSTDYYGLYFTDTLSLSARLAWTISGRWNRARIQLHDLIGEGLNAEHGFARFNPGTGLTYRLTPGLTAYVGYSEANRAPTAGELSCADPTSPCLLGAFLVSDPPLRQVVSRTYEAGLRGRLSASGAPRFDWYASLFRTNNSNDITLLATQINGFGYFANAGTTRRQGVETGFTLHSKRWEANFSYALLDATFRSNLTLASNSPAVDQNGDIQVTPADRIPMTPRHRITMGLDYSATRQWKIGGDLRFTSSQYLVGDASNQEAPLPGFTVVNFHTSYALSDALQLFGGVNNALDRTYYTYGAFASLGGLPPNYNLTNHRTYSPSAPRTWFAGVRLSF
jgi:outer membrane receptor protein involved in Fe transport